MTIDILKILINTLKNKPKICQKQSFYSSHNSIKTFKKIYKIVKKHT